MTKKIGVTLNAYVVVDTSGITFFNCNGVPLTTKEKDALSKEEFESLVALGNWELTASTLYRLGNVEKSTIHWED